MSLRSLKSTRDILAHLTSGPGASKLASNISKISLTYAIKGKHECAGAKHFLQDVMPRIQYNNPTIEFEVNKLTDPTTKPIVTVHSGERAKTIEVPRLHSDVICEKVFEARP
ncbi:hypothetical protein DFQ28_003440 [Apophysomyces sp. BC1034]|nr:hypothetical protein DFQ29_001105 [Apophysomyces sp. BC1021]KAG0193769.1 hypothetical protein DFQ28_003440 [Apophysomyces sp. BC1034]